MSGHVSLKEVISSTLFYLAPLKSQNFDRKNTMTTPSLQDIYLCYIQIVNIIFFFTFRLAKEFSFNFLDTAETITFGTRIWKISEQIWDALGKNFLITEQDEYQTRDDKNISIIKK